MLNKQTFNTLFFAEQAKKKKEVNGTSFKAKMADEADEAFKNYEKEFAEKEKLAKANSKSDKAASKA